jgi:hypothetical protein
MSRDDRRAAILGPARVCGADIEPTLLTRLVNDVGDDPDQLSLLQHALARCWAHWQTSGEPSPIEARHYDAVGTLAHALNQHAEEIFTLLPPPTSYAAPPPSGPSPTPVPTPGASAAQPVS